MASFSAVLGAHSNYQPFIPISGTVTGLRPNAAYDFYVDGKKNNFCVNYTSYGTGALNTPETTRAAALPLVSNSSGVITFKFLPFLVVGGSFGLFGGTPPAPFPKTFQFIGPDTIPAAVYTPPVIVAVNPVVVTPPPPLTVPTTTTSIKTSSTTTEKVISNITTQTSTNLGILRQNSTYGNGPGQSPLSEVSLYFDFIQSFYLDPASVNGSQSVSLTDIELFFKQKPHFKNNQSQIIDPGVYLYICKMLNGQPDLTKVYAESKVRLMYSEIFPSLDASSSTFFTFKAPLSLNTGESYGIVINFEDPQFSLWSATQGHLSVNTGLVCGSAYTSGKLFRASNYLEIDKDPKSLDLLFKPLADTDLKFYVNILEFDTSSKTIEFVNQDYEFIAFSDLVANNLVFSSFIPGENVFQDFGNTSATVPVTFYKTGNVSVNIGLAGGTYDKNSVRYNIYGTNTKFLSELEFGDSIVITDGTYGNTNVRKVVEIISDTQLRIDTPTSFTNTKARYKLTAIAEVENLLSNPNTAILNNSNANDKNRFIKDGVNYITFSNVGRGYANTDFIVFTGGALNGRADIGTNGTGNISSINITDAGYGFSAVTPTIYTSAGIAASPSVAAVMTITAGAQLKGEISSVKSEILDIKALPINSFISDLHFQLKGGSITNPQINFAAYNTVANTYSISSLNYNTIQNDSVDLQNYNAVILSKSLEIANKSVLENSFTEGKSSIIQFTLNTTNKFESPELHESLASIYSFNNVINNDATDEFGGNGLATARHISKKISFAKNRFAEDLRLITTVWKPLGTDIKFYAKIHNSKDEEAFDDKDWSELELKDSTSGKLYSSSVNNKDYIELTYGFRAFPEFVPIPGIISLANNGIGNTTINGVSSTFNTDLANGDIIVFYDPYFSNTTYAVSVVANTPVLTSFEIATPLANVSLASASLKIGKTGNTKHLAFNNIQNQNVVRYISSSLTEYDTYDTLAIKIVPLSNTSYIVPRVDDIRVIGVSA